MGLIEELRWRNMLQDIKPGTEDLLNRELVTGYIGFDPTADSLHIGSLLQVTLLMRFQKAGHKPIALLGGATGMIGDPSGKSTERNLLDEKTLQHNLACQKKQLEKFLNFNCGATSAEFVNNFDWFKGMSFLDFLRDVGKRLTVNYMMAKDSVKSRMTSDEGISFTEFSYQLIQGYDFYYLWKNKGVKLQMGGSDQWGNIITGTELIRRKDGGETFAFTIPLVTKSDGKKFGKSEQGNIWLDPKKTSPYRFYQYWLNVSDEDVSKLVRYFSMKDKEEIEILEKKHIEALHLRLLQKDLADEITERVHSIEDLTRAKQTTEILFGSSFDEFKKLDGKDIEDAFDENLIFRVEQDLFSAEVEPVSLLAEKTDIFPSKGEARKSIQGNGVSINKEKLLLEKRITKADLLHGRYLLVQKGKKNYYLIIAG
ncbi:MAG: tyrosine--tRNA ligase [Bacteroidetes bacterium]|nr:tyrosine--tRNA ligase [Bacteroidota bacterium]